MIPGGRSTYLNTLRLFQCLDDGFAYRFFVLRDASNNAHIYAGFGGDAGENL